MSTSIPEILHATASDLNHYITHRWEAEVYRNQGGTAIQELSEPQHNAEGTFIGYLIHERGLDRRQAYKVEMHGEDLSTINRQRNDRLNMQEVDLLIKYHTEGVFGDVDFSQAKLPSSFTRHLREVAKEQPPGLGLAGAALAPTTAG